ncbi:hypothetical protein F2P79_019360 [Pimephales promelas]|nr:hypothetical protein F2P79_019360 [Pimephales promelas]
MSDVDQKGLLSYSETDLRKPKGFAASLSWKKKKKRDLSQGLSSNSDIPGVKEDISEQEEYDNQVEVEPNQLGFEATMPMAEPPCTSDLSQTQDVLSDMSRPNEEDAGYMPSDLGSTSIQFIDSSLSDSDAYQTPPDSPVPEYFSSDYTDTQAVDRSSQYSTSGSDITDSFSPVPNMETSANTDTCTVHNSSTDLNLNDHSEVSKSGILADVEVKTITTDVVKKDSYLGNKKSTDAVHHNYMSSINQSSTTSVSEIPTTSIPSIPQSASRIYTTIKSSKKVTFDLSGHSEPISPDHSQKGLSNNTFYPDVETLTETSAEDHVNQERDKIKSANSSETSSDFLDSGVSSTSEIRPAITIHPPPHLDVSYQLFSTRSPQGEIDKQQKTCEDCEVDVQEASTQSSELTGHDETTAEGITTRNDLQMSEKNKYGPEVEEGSRPDPDYHYKSHVMPIQEPEPIEIITATESITIRNDLHMFVKEKYDQDVEERRVIYDENYYVSFDQEKDAEEEKIVDVLTQEQTLLHNISEKYEVEVQREELQMVQRTRGASALMEAEVCGVKVLTGQAEKQILCLDPLKPDSPVNQECGSEECTSAPPFSEPVKVSLADSSMETHSHLEIRPRPSAPHQPSGEITTLEDTARCIYQTSTDNPHAEREEHTSRNIDTSLKRTQESESQDHRPGKISAEETFTHAEDTRYTQGTVTSRDYISHRNWEKVSDRSSDEIREEDTAKDRFIKASPRVPYAGLAGMGRWRNVR